MFVIRDNTDHTAFSSLFLTAHILLNILELASYYQLGFGDGSGQNHS